MSAFRLSVTALFTALLLATTVFQPSPSNAQASCAFTLGFKALRDQISDVVGSCLENEHGNVANGVLVNLDTLQRTSGGLLVWRQADNWTAFTDGSTTWINGPQGLASRPNAGPLFPWESAAPPAAAPPAAAPPPAPATDATAPPTATATTSAQPGGEPWVGDIRFGYGYDSSANGAVPPGGTLDYRRGVERFVFANYRNVPIGATVRWEGKFWGDSETTTVTPVQEFPSPKSEGFYFYTFGSRNLPVEAFRPYHMEAAVFLDGKEMVRGQILVK